MLLARVSSVTLALTLKGWEALYYGRNKRMHAIDLVDANKNKYAFEKIFESLPASSDHKQSGN